MSYSLDFREKIVEYLEKEMSKERSVAKIFLYRQRPTLAAQGGYNEDNEWIM